MRKIVSLLFLLCLSAFAQTDTGRPVLESFFEASPYESINLSNLNVLVHAPVVSRGGPMPLDLGISVNAQMWAGTYIQGGLPHTAYNAVSWPTLQYGYIQSWGLGLGPVSFGINYNQGGVEATSQLELCPNQVTQTTVWRYTAIVDGYGAVHGMANLDQSDSVNCMGFPPIDDYTVDGSGLRLVSGGPHGAPFTVYDNAGTYIGYIPNANPTIIYDAHGNTLSQNLQTTSPYAVTFTGLLSTTPIVSFPNPSGPTGDHLGMTIPVTYTDGTGAAQNVTVAYYPNSGRFKTSFGACGYYTDDPNAAEVSPFKSITWADGSSLSVAWEMNGSYYDGRLHSVTLPTGAVATYAYSGGDTSQGFWCPNLNVPQLFPATITRTIGGGAWTFALTLDPSYSTNFRSYTTITKPDGSKIAYTFVYGYATNKIIYDTDGTTILDTVKTCYNSTLSNCSGLAWKLAQIQSVANYDYVPGVANPSGAVTTLDNYGNPTEIDRYDFGPTLVNKTITQYGSWNGSSCVSMASTSHITNKPCDIQVQDASGNLLSHLRFNYNTSTGDLLNTYSYTSASNYLTSSATYNPNGAVATATGADGVQTTFAYNGSGGCPSSAPAFLPTSATNADGTVSATWDCNGAVPITTTGLNGLITTTTYGDPLYRVTQESDNGGGAPTNYTYTSTTRASVDMTFNSGNSIADTTTTLDTLGRVISVQHRQGPSSSNYDTVTLAYDSTGHQTSTSVACVTTLGGTCSTHASEDTYDGLNRVHYHTVKTSTNGLLTYDYSNGDVKAILTPDPGEAVKQAVVERDGLGRTISVCQWVNTGGPLQGYGACGQRDGGSGYLTKYTLDPLGQATQVSRNAQAGATAVNTCVTYDFLGRVTETAIPESGGTCTSGVPSGNTANFYYDTAHGSCSGGLAGHVNEAVDAAGNVICSQYDSIGRTSSVTFPSGPNAANTPTRNFYYGTGHGSGANVVGRLSEVSTSTTDEQFGYDEYGRLVDVWEHPPSLGGASTPAFVQQNIAYTANGTLVTSKALAYPSSVTVGDLLFVVFSNANQNAISSVTDTRGNAWTFLPLKAANGVDLQAFYTFTTSSGTDTVTGTFGGTGAGYVTEAIAEYSNVTAIDSHAENSGASGTQPSTTLTTTAVNDLVVDYVIGLGSTTLAGGSGYTMRTASTGNRTGIEDKTASSAGSVTGTWTGVGGAWSAGIASFLASAGTGSYFHTSASFFDNGALSALSGIPGVSDYSYGLDGEGRSTTATSGGVAIVSNVLYDAAGNATEIDYANGDKDAYTYDPASENMTQYQFKLGAAQTTDTGVLTWNPNGTLGALAITDNITSADTQTCSSSHDDLLRLASWNCGALWSESYAYSADYAGNVTKSGSLSFAPGYTASNNHMLSPYTYDANGLMLHDATLSQDYSWDSTGGLVGIGTTVLSNNALGGAVQKTIGGANTYFLDSPIGSLGTGSSLTAPVFLRIPLPGGGSIKYDSAGNQQFLRRDFRGSTVLVTNRVARSLQSIFCYGPMGEVYCGTGADSSFEGVFEDTSSGLVDFDATRYSGAQGRSISPTGDNSNGYIKTNSPF